MLSHADHSVSPPCVEVPREYNAAWDLLAPGPVWLRVATFSGAALGLALFVQQRSNHLRGNMSRQLDELADGTEVVADVDVVGGLDAG